MVATISTAESVTMPLRTDIYGFKSLARGDVRFVGGKTRDQVRRSLVSAYKRHADVRRKVFEWSDETGGIIIRRVM